MRYTHINYLMLRCRCRNEFSFLQTALSVSNLPRLIGFTLYLGELLVNMKVGFLSFGFCHDEDLLYKSPRCITPDQLLTL